ncbi:MAG: excinuclease ABC subunit UvrC [Bacteroidia bacterium]|nr:excinuclease ABC subunit UvrC [Bacteroidia bacterium]
MPLSGDKLKTIIAGLPDRPGVYHYMGKEGKIIYIGKAKSLKKRVSSYFSGKADSARIRLLVKNIEEIRYTIVDTEYEALLLENNLIKEHQPRYNVLLKDDKTYPWIVIRNERFPRIHPTRTFVRDGSSYFGPYASGRTMKTLLELVRKIFPVRECSYTLSEENISKRKFRLCVEYHVGNCKGPCEGLQTESDYNESIAQARHILKGHTASVIRELKKKMNEHAVNMEFEKAQFIKEKLDRLEQYRAKSTVVSPTVTDIDVFSILSDEDYGYVSFFRVVNGAVVQSHVLEMKKKMEENENDLLQRAIVEIRDRFGGEMKEVIVPFQPEVSFPGIRFLVPQRGDKRQLLELSHRNADFYRKERERRRTLVDPERHTRRILETAAKDLRLKEEPRHIECFDNSNLQGTNPVSACVVFRNGKPSKKEYRHFNIRSVQGPDDFSTMKEVVRRRYARLLEEKVELPQLIVVDGGKGQLSAATEVLEELGLRGKIAIIGIAKRLEEIYYPGDTVPLYLDKKSETLRLIQYMRDEAHRFGITHHRKRREKNTIKSELLEIPGIGKAMAEKLLRNFGSVKRIREAGKEELINEVGKRRMEVIWKYFNP